MTELDGFLPQTAYNLIRQYGKVCTYVSRTSGAYNPATGTGAVTETVLTPAITLESYGRIQLESGLIGKGDQKVTIADLELSPTGIQPKEGDSITVDSQAFAVVDAEAVYCGELVAIWTLQVRQA